MAPVTVAYGDDPSQLGDLWLPREGSASSRSPLVVLIHGGFWRAAYGLRLMDAIAGDLVDRGFAVWNIEYRRVGEGGGYPATLDDVALAVDAVADLAEAHSLDLSSTVVVGHSAGAHLAWWTAGRATLPIGSPGADPVVIPRLAVGMGGVFDLRAGDAEQLGAGAVTDFIGGSVAEHPGRYDIATPKSSCGVGMVSVRSLDDDVVSERFTMLNPPGDVVALDVPGDHFVFLDPSSEAWSVVVDQIER